MRNRYYDPNIGRFITKDPILDINPAIIPSMSSSLFNLQNLLQIQRVAIPQEKVVVQLPSTYSVLNPRLPNISPLSISIFIVPFMLSTPQNLHFYLYCVNNPVNYTDPTGFGIKEWIWNKIENWACKSAWSHDLCCIARRIKCYSKLELKTCPPEEQEKCDTEYLECLAKTPPSR